MTAVFCLSVVLSGVAAIALIFWRGRRQARESKEKAICVSQKMARREAKTLNFFRGRMT